MDRPRGSMNSKPNKATKDPTLEKRFETNMIHLSELLTEIITKLHQEKKTTLSPLIVSLIGGFIKGFSTKKTLENFIFYSHKNWSQIKNRDEDFFVENADQIFADLKNYVNKADGHVEAFKELFTLKNSKGEYEVGTDDRDAIWAFFDSLVKIGIKYLHKVKGPVFIQHNGKKKKAYLNNFSKNRKFLGEIKISGRSGHAKIWGLSKKLVWPNK